MWNQLDFSLYKSILTLMPPPLPPLPLPFPSSLPLPPLPLPFPSSSLTWVPAHSDPEDGTQISPLVDVARVRGRPMDKLMDQKSTQQNHLGSTIWQATPRLQLRTVLQLKMDKRNLKGQLRTCLSTRPSGTKTMPGLWS